MRRYLAALLLLFVFGAVAPPVAAEPEAVETPPAPTPAPWDPPALHAQAAILVNLDDGRVLYDKDIHTSRPPASLTKVVTALVVRDRYQLDDTVLVQPFAASIHGSRLGLEVGMQFTVRDLLYALMLRSGNDVAIALAEHHPGGYDHFIGLMNEKARALGAFDSRFANPHGLDAEGHYSSPWDMALFGRQLMTDPVLAEIVATPSHSIPWPDGTTREVRNGNQLLTSYEGSAGVKTGFTNRAGRCLVSAAHTPAGTLLAVVLHSDHHYADTTALFEFAKARAMLQEEGSAPDVPPAPIADEPPAVQLAGPPPVPEAQVQTADILPLSSGALGDYRWSALMALLAAAMLLTLFRGQRTPPLREAAQYHPFLEPIVEASEDVWDRRPVGSQRRT